jgi:hypothetical protein
VSHVTESPYDGKPTCGCHKAIFLSAPNAKIPLSSQSAAAGCLLAPAARYWALRSVILKASARLMKSVDRNNQAELNVEYISPQLEIHSQLVFIKVPRVFRLDVGGWIFTTFGSWSKDFRRQILLGNNSISMLLLAKV